MVGSLFDDLDDLPEGTVERLVEVALGRGAKTSIPGGDTDEIIRVRPKIKFKRPPSSKKPGLRYFEPDLTNGNYNKTVVIEVELPAYLVMGMHEVGDDGFDSNMRVAVREYLDKRGKWWWYPRFLISGKYDVQAAKDRFTRKFG